MDIAVFYPGIRIDGVDVSGKSLDEAKAMFQSTREKHIDDVLDVSFQVGEDKIKLKTDGMTLSSNIDEVLIEAYNYGKTSQLEGVDGLIERYNLNAVSVRCFELLKRKPSDSTSVSWSLSLRIRRAVSLSILRKPSQR